MIFRSNLKLSSIQLWSRVQLILHSVPLFFSRKESRRCVESYEVFSLHSVGRSHWWSKCNLPVQTQLHHWAFIALHPPPLDTKICTAAALLPRNWMSFQEYPPFHKQDSVTGSPANSPSLQTGFPHINLPLSGARLANESSGVTEIVKSGGKEIYNCTFSKRRTWLLLSFLYHFPITWDWPEPLFNQCIPSYELRNLKITLWNSFTLSALPRIPRTFSSTWSQIALKQIHLKCVCSENLLFLSVYKAIHLKKSIII